VGRDAGVSVKITVHDEVVAELHAVRSESEPGAAAKQLLRVMARLPEPRGRKTTVSSHVKAHLHGSRPGDPLMALPPEAFCDTSFFYACLEPQER
jgi:antitoxin (DNA-binding transcriptional repressor) of toxin-antitoxin stability system